MPANPTPPAQAGKRPCGICGRPLSRYNKSDICEWHSPEDTAKFRAEQWENNRKNRELMAFVKEFHAAGTVDDMFAEASKPAAKPRLKRAATEIEQYHEALGLLKVGSMVFRLTMPAILRIRATQQKHKTARAVMMYVMQHDLGMSVEDIVTFFGYRYAPNATDAIKWIERSFIEDEDIILAVDLVREDYHRMSQTE